MKHDEHVQALEETLRKLKESSRWLRRSFARCLKASTKRNLTPADLDAFEALTGRYARTSDMILQKLFRGLEIRWGKALAWRQVQAGAPSDRVASPQPLFVF